MAARRPGSKSLRQIIIQHSSDNGGGGGGGGGGGAGRGGQATWISIMKHHTDFSVIK